MNEVAFQDFTQISAQIYVLNWLFQKSFVHFFIVVGKKTMATVYQALRVSWMLSFADIILLILQMRELRFGGHS